MKQENKQQSDISYIKSIMARSEINFADFSRFFLFLAIYRFVFLIGLDILSLAGDSFLAGIEPRFRIFLAQPILWSIGELFLFIPVALVLWQFYKKTKEKNQGISLWLFQIMIFILVFCDVILPFVSIAVTASVKAARLFPVVTVALLLFFSGVFIDSRGLKKFACGYAVVPMVCLIFLGIPKLYYELSDKPLTAMSVTFATVYTIVSIFIFDFYPVIGYAVLSGFMYKKGKAAGTDEL